MSILHQGINNRLEKIAFADDLCLLSQRYNEIQEKIRLFEAESRKSGTNDKWKEDLRINCNRQEALETNGEIIVGRVDSFRYLGNMVTDEGGTDEDVERRIRTAEGTFA